MLSFLAVPLLRGWIFIRLVDIKCFWFTFLINRDGIIFIISLIIIFFSIIIFSFSYFGEGVDLLRFIIIFFSFALSISILIIHNRIATLFIAWDGLGIRSFFLVAYYINWSSINGAMVTVLTNRFGDFCLFWFFSPLFTSNNFSSTIFFPIFLLLGASTKRAQYPFRNWLPLAIAAPTPVSSLVHRRTLVTAGVYLIIQYFSFLESKTFREVIFLLGILTIFLGGVRSLLEKDFKKIVALRTLSQIGLLTLRLRMSIPTLTFLHLIAHAFFKRCLFIQVGNLIVRFFGNQDRRGFNKSFTFSGFTSFTLRSCLIRLCGIGFFRGFFTKEAVLIAFTVRKITVFIILILWFSMGFTFLYSLRIVWGILSSAVSPVALMGGCGVIIYPLLLLILGVAGGYFLINCSCNSILFFCGAEKFFPIIILVTLFMVIFSWEGLAKFIKNMVFLDFLISSTVKLNKNLFKVADFIILTQLGNVLRFLVKLKLIDKKILQRTNIPLQKKKNQNFFHSHL